MTTDNNQPITSQPSETAGGAPAFVQTIVKTLLCTPLLHRFSSKNVMVIGFTGKKSGKQYHTPVTYVEDGPRTIYLTTDSKWWRNLVGGAPVTLTVRGKRLTGNATVVDDPAEVERAIRGVLQKAPKDADAYLIKPNLDGSLKPAEVSRAVAARKKIVITLDK